jgi:hypothetical protein
MGGGNIGNCEVTPQAMWPVAKSLMNKDREKVQPIVNGFLGTTYHQNEKANVILFFF